MTAAVTTKKLKLQRGNGATPTELFATIGEVTNISGPDESTEQLEVTSFDSDAKEFLASLPDSGEVTFEMNFIGSDAEQQGLRADLRGGVLRNFKLIIADAALETACTTCAFAAIITNLSGPQGSVNAALTQSCTLKVSGQPTWTYATAA